MAKIDPALLRTRGLGRKVLDLLSLLSPLPARGYVAGQAVASAIDRILGTGPCIINDIDVFMGRADFYEQTGLKVPEKDWWSASVNDSIVFRASELEQDADPGNYGLWLARNRISERSMYSVERAHQAGLLNRIYVSYYAGEPTYTRSKKTHRFMRDLVLGFDLNNVQVALCCATAELHFTSAFERYFAGRELRVESTVTPVQTMLRYLRKREQLGCFGNDEAQVQFVLNVVRMNQHSDPTLERDRENAFIAGKPIFTRNDYTLKTGMGAAGSTLSFGQKYKGVFDTHRSELGEFLHLLKYPGQELYLARLTDKAMAQRVAGLSSAPSRQVNRFWELYFPASKLVQRRRDLFTSFIGTLPPRAAAPFLAHVRELGDTVLVGIENEKPMAEALPVLREHEEFATFVRALNFGDKAALVRVAKARMKRADLRDAWGVFRTMPPSSALDVLESPRILDIELERVRAGLGSLHVERLPLPATVLGVTVEELLTGQALTGQALADEGARMMHCVAGYVVSVQEKWSRIISLRAGATPEECSTVEWRWSQVEPTAAERDAGAYPIGHLAVHCAQNFSFDNTVPPAMLRETEYALRTQFNAWLKENPKLGWELLWPTKHLVRLLEHGRTLALKKAAQ